MWNTARVSQHPEPGTPVSEQTRFDAPAPEQLAWPKVVYVMGAGRSGSTILGVTLGNCERVFFAGELDRWLARAGVPRDGVERERFWARVRERVDYAPELAGKTTWLERSSSLLDPRRWPTRRRLRGSYRRISQDLYRAIAHVSGATHVIDSSHYPMRAREMQSLEGIDLYLLLLVRDPHSVLASLGRSDVPERRFGILRANAYLWLTYLLAAFVFARHPADRRLFVRHEDFLASPEAVLAQILRQCDAPATTPNLTRLRTGVPFHGNRLIKSEVVALGAGVRTQPRRSPLTILLQQPWAFVFSRLRPAVTAAAHDQPTPTPA
jgi:Sulfotransferase family